MAIASIGTYSNQYYDSSRPFVFGYTSSVGNTINLVYIIQIENPTTNAWETVTQHLKQPMEWSVTEFRIDPSQIITDFVEFGVAQYLPTPDNHLVMDNHRVKCRVKLTEQTLSAGVLSYNNDENTWFVDREFFAIDHTTKHEETYNKAQHQFAYAHWLGGHNVTEAQFPTPEYPGAAFMTDMPVLTRQCRGDNMIMSFATEIKGLTLKADIVREDGTTHTNIPVGAVLGGLGVYQLGVGIPQMLYWLTLSGNLNPVWSAANRWDRVTWRMMNGTTPYTKDYTFIVEDCGCQEEHIRLWWRNDRNGVDSWTFKGTYSEKVTSSFERFQKPLGHRRAGTENNLAGGYIKLNTFNQQSSGVGKINIKAKKQMTVMSAFLNQEHLEWLSQVSTSTNVWIEDRAASSITTWKLTPVTIRSTSFQTKARNTRLGKIKLDLEYSNPVTTNRA